MTFFAHRHPLMRVTLGDSSKRISSLCLDLILNFIMTKFRIILIILGALVVLTLPVVYFLSQSRNIPVSHAAVRLILGQTPDYRLSLRTLAVENAYSSEYQLAIPTGHYNVKIMGETGAVFFSGKISKNLVRYPADEIDVKGERAPRPDLLVEPLGEIVLLLPYYPRAKKIVFFDENNVEKMQVDLTKVTLPKDYSKKLCGNGICDSNENILFCYKDCHKK